MRRLQLTPRPDWQAKADAVGFVYHHTEGQAYWDESVAYADSSSDLPMLEAVGFPVAVNPEPRLASIARKRGWLVEDFRPAPGFRHPLLPFAGRWRGNPSGQVTRPVRADMGGSR